MATLFDIIFCERANAPRIIIFFEKRQINIEVPQELLISSFEDPIRAIVDSTYPNRLENYKNVDFLQFIAILTSTIEVMDKINHYVLDLIPGKIVLCI